MVNKYYRLEIFSQKYGGWTTDNVYPSSNKKSLDFRKNIFKKQGTKTRTKLETEKKTKYKRGDIVKSYLGRSEIVSGSYNSFLGDVEYSIATKGYSRRLTGQKGLKLIKRK